jgi:hypothetical protein
MRRTVPRPRERTRFSRMAHSFAFVVSRDAWFSRSSTVATRRFPRAARLPCKARMRTRMTHTEHRIQARNTARLSHSHTGQPAKSSICLIVHAIDH